MSERKRKKRMGRPPLPDSERRSMQQAVRFSPGEWAAVKQGAKTAGLPLSTFLRNAALAACEQQVARE